MKNQIIGLLIVLCSSYASASTFTQEQVDEAMALRVATIENSLKTQITDVIAEKTAKKLGVSYKNSNAVSALEEYLNQNYSNALAVELAIIEFARSK